MFYLRFLSKSVIFSTTISGYPMKISRRNFIKTAASTAACTTFGFSIYSKPQTANNSLKIEKIKRPNILYIMSDDHAYQAISAYGHPISKLASTPNIDRIARKGALFTRNYCANSLCGPSRACVITGKHSHANGYMRNDTGTFDGNQLTLPKVFRANGYQTALLGKWHIPTDPTGFDFWRIFPGQGSYNNPVMFEPDTSGKKQSTIYKGYATDLITAMANERIYKNINKEKPFFFMVHHKAPHRNWIPPERYYNLFDKVTFPEPENFQDDYSKREAAAHQDMTIIKTLRPVADLKLFESKEKRQFPKWIFSSTITEEEIQKCVDAYTEKNNQYFEMKAKAGTQWTSEKEKSWRYQRYLQDYLATIRAVDDSVGKLLDYLEKSGLMENTIIVYASDQGFFLGEHGWFDKRFMYEESFRMPLMMCYPDQIKPGIIIDELTQNIDFAPTFLDMCGIKIPEEMQGISFRKLLNGNKPDQWRKSLYYHYYEYPAEHSVRRHCGVTTKEWKLIHFYQQDRWELYHLTEDPMEMNNIYGNFGTETITAKLKQELLSLQAQYKVPPELCQKETSAK